MAKIIEILTCFLGLSILPGDMFALFWYPGDSPFLLSSVRDRSNKSPFFRLVLGNDENIVSKESETRTPSVTVASTVCSGIRVSNSRKMVLAHSSVVCSAEGWDSDDWSVRDLSSATGEVSGDDELDETEDPFKEEASCGKRPMGNEGWWYWCRRCLSPSLYCSAASLISRWKKEKKVNKRNHLFWEANQSTNHIKTTFILYVNNLNQEMHITNCVKQQV